MENNQQQNDPPPAALPVRRLELSLAVSVSIVGSFIILLIGALYYARSFFLPLVLALLITLTFTPLIRAMSRYGVPAGVSAVGLVLLLGGAIGRATLFPLFLTGKRPSL